MHSSSANLNELWPIIKEVIDSDGEFTFLPQGISMLPLIRQGKDSVTLAKPKDIKVGDAVFYRRDNGQFVLHRIVKKKANEYIMCGDNQFVLEKGINASHILAKVIKITRDNQEITEDNPKYKKYIKGLSFRRFKLRTRYKLARIKHKLFKKRAD